MSPRKPGRPATAIHDAVQLDGVRISADSVVDIEDGHVAVLVPLDKVRRLTLRHTFRSAHPFAQSLLGLGLLAIGYWPAVHLFEWFRDGGTLYLPFALLTIPTLWGLLLILSAPRRGYVIDVDGDEGRRRLLFNRRTDVASVRAFLREASKRFGVRVEDDAPR